jgi:hypothetical protein
MRVQMHQGPHVKLRKALDLDNGVDGFSRFTLQGPNSIDCLYRPAYIYTLLYTNVYNILCIYIYINLSIYIYICKCIYLDILFIFAQIYIYIYLFVYIYLYVCIYIYLNINSSVLTLTIYINMYFKHKN